MHVRLAFATAVQVDADVLVVDEVLAVGDAAFQQKCYEQFQRLKDEGRTILFVTHDMSAVQRFCDRALLLERGRMVNLGDPDRDRARVPRAQLQPADRRAGRRRAPPRRPARGARSRRSGSSSRRATARRRCCRATTRSSASRCSTREDLDNPTLQVTLRNEAHQAVFVASSDTAAERPAPLAGGHALRRPAALRLPRRPRPLRDLPRAAARRLGARTSSTCARTSAASWSTRSTRPAGSPSCRTGSRSRT